MPVWLFSICVLAVIATAFLAARSAALADEAPKPFLETIQADPDSYPWTEIPVSSQIEFLASCTECGCLVAVVPTLNGREVWDPAFAFQRSMRSEVGSVTMTSWGQHFGLGYSMTHECPPGEYPPRTAAQQERRHEAS